MRADAGLQPERTALAWSRTALSMVVGGAVGVRVLPTLLGPVGLVVALAVVVAGAVLGLVARRRVDRAAAVLVRGGHAGLHGGVLPDGRLLLVLAAVCSAVAGVAAVGLVVTALVPALGRP